MANMFIGNTYRFKPFSFQEMLQPVQLYTQSYDNLETELNNLDILANDIPSKLNPKDVEDAKILEKYKAFQNEMNNALESFYQEGLNQNSRKKLASLKSLYSKDLNPINTAYERRVKDSDFVKQMRAQHPGRIIEGIGESTSAYLNGKSPDPIVVDLDNITTAAKNASAGMSKQFIENIDLQSVDGYIGRYLKHGIERGITADMVKEFTDFIDSGAAIESEQGAALYNMFKQLQTANNYENLSEGAQKRVNASIIQGLVSGAAADKDINYTADNYWDVKAKEQSIELAKAKLKALENKGSGTDTDYDLRTQAGVYIGKNNDVSVIADKAGTTFTEPVEYNGTKIYDPVQAYNIIHKDDSKINELNTDLDNILKNSRKAATLMYRNDTGTGLKPKYVNGEFVGYDMYVNNQYLETASNLYNELLSLEKNKSQAQKDLKDISLTEKEVQRIRDYSKSSSTGMLTPNELTNFGTILASDFSTGTYKEKTATIFSQTNSKDGLEDAVKTMSIPIMQQWQAGNELKIFDSKGKQIKDKEFKDLIDSETGGLNPNNIASIDLDFRAAETGSVKLVTTDGHVYYVDASYLGEQADAFIHGQTGLNTTYNELIENTSITKSIKSELLNKALGRAASSIQPQFTKNREKSMGWTLSDKILFGSEDIDIEE